MNLSTGKPVKVDELFFMLAVAANECHVDPICLCLLLHSCSCEDRFVQERGVVRLWEVVRCDFLLPRN